ncbi:uncharacterized protein SRS1_17600 [Sporisorium reilianum f. sp. reilianum]|uniref:Uncharacterized protein n=1 Tax=Sporisorium reilianum f. sp. reilianum TaxID=72559 RepID=A0A2N8UI47_9BASI|nr:uncharacterized protein SRS1_17600 [Sporisorium reilianum f. sp. reilianum]
MAVALIRALLEYAQLVLVLITDPEAVQICYAQHCPVSHMKDERVRDALVSTGRGARERTAPEPARNDPISTNMLATPSQRSESDAGEAGHHQHRHREECTAPAHSICACPEEDFLVACEDDVRKPCIVKPEPQSAQTLPSHAERRIDPVESFSKPADEIKAVAASTAPLVKKVDVQHHWKDELLPAAEATPMDIL